VQVFSPEGEFITGWGQRGEYGLAATAEPTDGFWGPRSIAVDSEERVYVADTGNKRVRVYTNDGQFIRDIGSGGSAVGQLDEPTGLVISPNGILYVADTWNRRISAFTLDGQPASIFLTADGSPTNNYRVRAWFDDLGNRPYLALDAQRNLLYVTDPDAGRVLVYDTRGNCVGSFGQLNRESFDASQFASVGGVVVSGEGAVYVADSGSGRILRFDPFPSAPAGQSGVILQPQAVTPEVTPETSAELPLVETTLELIAPAEVTAEATVEAAG
jgi:sugar lactone lactonase YvrE